MSRKRISVATFVTACITALAIGPFGAHAAPATGEGSTSTAMDLVEVKLSNVPSLGTISAALGSITSDATTVGVPEATLVFEAARAGGESTGGRTVSSKNGDDSQQVSAPIDAAGITGAINIVQMTAEATDHTATAVLGALGGNIDIGPLGFATGIAENGIRSHVDRDASASSMGATFGPIDVGLDDLLPASLMDQLPLSVVMDLVNGLGLELPASLDSQVKAVTDLLDSIADLESVMAQIDAAEAQIFELAEGNQAVADATAALEQAQAAFDAATAAVDELNAQIDAAQTELTAAEAQMASAQSDYDEATATLSGAQAQKAILEGQLAACGVDPAVCAPIQAQLDTVNATIATATADQAEAQAAMAAAQAAIDAANAEITTAQGGLPAAGADVTAAQAQVDVAQSAVNAAIDAIDSAQIDAIRAQIDALTAQIDELLATIDGLLGDLPDLQALLDGLLAVLEGAPIMSIDEIAVQLVTSADATHGAGAVTCGASGITVLGTPVAGGGCDAITDAFGQLSSGVNEILGSLPVVGNKLPKATFEGMKSSTSGSKAPNAEGVTKGTASLSALHFAIPSVALTDVLDSVLQDAIALVEETVASLPVTVPVPVDLQAVIDQVTAQLDDLPVGDTLSGLRTIGVDARVAGMRSESVYQAAPRAPGTNNPNPQQPAERPVSNPGGESLPFTGSPTSLVAALALWLMVAGMALTLLSERGFRKNPVRVDASK
ncbi:MAG TPA: hypothetical protein VNC78_08670 [Actinomycetota bacterium]|nr:hypothetical protein [Actinomycetota bacterium]